MKLSDYLARIGFNGSLRADLRTLQGLQRAHLHAVPFENLDVQLQRPMTLDSEASFDKIVRQRRGGWCYEQNGLMGWALTQIGFDVVRLSAGVERESLGDTQLGNHLCLLVKLDQPYLVDVGFGGSLAQPIPLSACGRLDTPYQIALEPLESGYWRFTEQVRGDPFSFDFRTLPADETLLAAKSDWLQTDATSPFVRNLVVQRRIGDTHLSLRGRVVTRMDAAQAKKTLLNSPAELTACLHTDFQLDVPEAESLWPAICARHAIVFAD